MGSRILIVDDDPWIRRMVGTMLQRGGHRVEQAVNGADGLRKAASFVPDLIISDILMDSMDGWTFVRSLRSNPKMSLVPVIFLTALDSEEDRIRGFRLGADDYLPKPFRFEELNLRVERSLRNFSLMRSKADDIKDHEDPNIGLRGDLAQLGVSALLTILEMERKSGILVLVGRATGRLFFREGRVLAALIDDGTNGPEAVYAMLGWGEGRFEFTALDVDMEDQIQTTTTHLLMEGARRIDEAEAGLG